MKLCPTSLGTSLQHGMYTRTDTLRRKATARTKFGAKVWPPARKNMSSVGRSCRAAERSHRDRNIYFVCCAATPCRSFDRREIFSGVGGVCGSEQTCGSRRSGKIFRPSADFAEQPCASPLHSRNFWTGIVSRGPRCRHRGTGESQKYFSRVRE